jgi:hypothetical protein
VKPPHEDEAAVQAEDTEENVATTHVVSFAGRVDPLELILHALEVTGASAVGRLLDHRPHDSG